MAKIGVYVCSCDEKIKDNLDIDAILEHARGLSDVVKAVHHEHLCAEDGLKSINEDIKNGTIDRVVVAGCTPITHEKFIGDAVEDAAAQAAKDE